MYNVVTAKSNFYTAKSQSISFFSIFISKSWTEIKSEQTYTRLDSFGWKNLFEELIHNFGHVMSARKLYKRNSNTNAKTLDSDCDKQTIQNTNATKCDSMWNCYKWSGWIALRENESIEMAMSPIVKPSIQTHGCLIIAGEVSINETRRINV